MHWILRDLSKWAAVVRQSGIRHACKFVLFVIRARIMRREDQRRESRLGIVVEKNVRLEQLDVGSENKQFGFSYVPSPRRAVLTLLANLQDDLAQFTFVDFGSGEGRVLLVASEFPFREIIGIEFAKELHETAVANIAKAIPDAEVNRVRAIHSDAVDFAIPKCNCVFYFHNPFGQEVFTQVMRNIEQAHLKDGISIYVLYQQVGAEFETNKTNSISFLRHAPFLTERTVHFRSFWDRFLLGSHELFIFQSQVWPA